MRSGNCELQNIANDLGIIHDTYQKTLPHAKWSDGFPLVRNYEKCIKCMRCIQVCDKVQDLGIWDITSTGSRTHVDVSQNLRIEQSDCAICGQCIAHCPTGALRERDDADNVFAALADPEMITVVQIAPAIRTSWGEQ